MVNYQGQDALAYSESAKKKVLYGWYLIVDVDGEDAKLAVLKLNNYFFSYGLFPFGERTATSWKTAKPFSTLALHAHYELSRKTVCSLQDSLKLLRSPNRQRKKVPRSLVSKMHVVTMFFLEMKADVFCNVRHFCLFSQTSWPKLATEQLSIGSCR